MKSPVSDLILKKRLFSTFLRNLISPEFNFLLISCVVVHVSHPYILFSIIVVRFLSFVGPLQILESLHLLKFR